VCVCMCTCEDPKSDAGLEIKPALSTCTYNEPATGPRAQDSSGGETVQSIPSAATSTCSICGLLGRYAKMHLSAAGVDWRIRLAAQMTTLVPKEMMDSSSGQNRSGGHASDVAGRAVEEECIRSGRGPRVWIPIFIELITPASFFLPLINTSSQRHHV
jgi:hypothetical protein